MGGKGSGNPNVKNTGFGSRPRAVDDEYRSRIKGVPKTRRWTKEICILQLEEIMDILRKKINDDEFKDLQVIIDKMMDIIRYLYPPVQQNLNVNVDLTTDKILERLRAAKKERIVELKEEEEDGR